MDLRFPSRSLLRLLSQDLRRPKQHRLCRACALALPTRRSIFGIPGIPGIPETAEKSRDRPAWHKKDEYVPKELISEYKKFPVVTSESLRTRISRPKRVQMLMREYIEDSLYNPHYGYFPKEAFIFSPKEPIDFRKLHDDTEFDAILKERYDAFEDQLDEKQVNETRQLWHTPTEVFQPHYGESIARYMAANYKVSLYPYYDLVIYEMGAGNGTLMINILDYLRDTSPEIYERTQYKIIEISSALANIQSSRVQEAMSDAGHGSKVEIINRSIFDWDQYVSSPCFFIALEVFDNFAHDSIRYDRKTGEALQSTVIIDGQNEMYELYSKDLDPIALRFLQIRDMVAPGSFKVPKGSGWRYWVNQAGSVVKISPPEYIPTRLMQFFDVLHNYFPGHRLISSDFNRLPSIIPGVSTPVVQTRYQREMVQVTTPLVYQGRFDIMFPTDFGIMEAMYRAITGKLTRVSSQEEFLQRWAFLEDTETKSGENPLLSYYQNASVMITL